MGYLILILASVALFASLGVSIGYLQSRTNTFFIAAGVPLATGAYTTAILLHNNITELELLLLASMICAALTGALIASITAFHDRRVLDIIGLALLLVGGAIVRSWYSPGSEPGSWASLTNGSFGFSSFQRPTLFGLEFPSTRIAGLLLALMALCLSITIVRILERSIWGASVSAIRDNRLQAALDGHHIVQRQLGVGLICAACIGAAGSAYALVFQYVDPSLWSLQTSIGICLIPMIWPVGPFWLRAVFGSVAYIILPELLSALSVASPYESYFRNIIFFAIALLVSSRRPYAGCPPVEPLGPGGRSA